MPPNSMYLNHHRSRRMELVNLLVFLQGRKVNITLQVEYLLQAAADCEAHLRQLQEAAHNTPMGVYGLIRAGHEVHQTYSCGDGCIMTVMRPAAVALEVGETQLQFLGTPYSSERRLARACHAHLREIDDMLEQLEDLRLELWAYTIDVYAKWL